MTPTVANLQVSPPRSRATASAECGATEPGQRMGARRREPTSDGLQPNSDGLQANSDHVFGQVPGIPAESLLAKKRLMMSRRMTMIGGASLYVYRRSPGATFICRNAFATPVAVIYVLPAFYAFVVSCLQEVVCVGYGVLLYGSKIQNCAKEARSHTLFGRVYAFQPNSSTCLQSFSLNETWPSSGLPLDSAL